MHSLNFSTDFLYWIFNYVTHRHFVKIDSNCSSHLTAKYGLPRGSILGPILFNLCVADMSRITPNSNCIQYADDSITHRNCKIQQYPNGIYLLKVTKRNNRTRSEICSKLTIKTHFVSLLLTLNIFHFLF